MDSSAAWESSLAALGVFQRVSPDHSVEGESGGRFHLWHLGHLRLELWKRDSIRSWKLTCHLWTLEVNKCIDDYIEEKGNWLIIRVVTCMHGIATDVHPCMHLCMDAYHYMTTE